MDLDGRRNLFAELLILVEFKRPTKIFGHVKGPEATRDGEPELALHNDQARTDAAGAKWMCCFQGFIDLEPALSGDTLSLEKPS